MAGDACVERGRNGRISEERVRKQKTRKGKAGELDSK